MKQVLMRGGRVIVEDMPLPRCGAGQVLVRSAYSLISSGTETMTLDDSAPPTGAAVWSHRLQKVGEVARMVLDRGLTDTRNAVASRLEGASLVSGGSSLPRSSRSGSTDSFRCPRCSDRECLRLSWLVLSDGL